MSRAPFSFPYGFPTSYSRRLAGTDLTWPRCTNAEAGSFGHECSQPARYIGTIETGAASTFCAYCKMHGREAVNVTEWQSLPQFPNKADGTPAISFSLTRAAA